MLDCQISCSSPVMYLNFHWLQCLLDISEPENPVRKREEKQIYSAALPMENVIANEKAKKGRRFSWKM